MKPTDYFKPSDFLYNGYENDGPISKRFADTANAKLQKLIEAAPKLNGYKIDGYDSYFLSTATPSPTLTTHTAYALFIEALPVVECENHVPYIANLYYMESNPEGNPLIKCRLCNEEIKANKWETVK